MALSAFGDKSKMPRRDELIKTLGQAGPHWKSLLDHLTSACEPITEAWTYSGKSWGWALQLKHKKRTILYLTPCEGYFFAGFALGEKAVKAARLSSLPVSIMDIVESAKKYAEGRAVRIEIRNSKAISAVKKLISIKMAN